MLLCRNLGGANLRKIKGGKVTAPDRQAEMLLVVLCPLSQRQLCYLQDGAARLRVCAAAVVFASHKRPQLCAFRESMPTYCVRAALFSGWSDCAGKPSVPWRHASHWLLLDELPHVCLGPRVERCFARCRRPAAHCQLMIKSQPQ